MQIVSDHLDVQKHLLQVAGDRDLLHGISELAVFDPESPRAARIVAGDHVDAETDHLGNVETFLHRANDLLGSVLARLKEEIGRRHGRWQHA